MRTRLVWVAVAATALVALAAGCGDDDGGGGDETESGTLSAKEWAEQADAICESSNEERSQVADSLNAATQSTDPAGDLQKLVNVDSQLIAKVDQLAADESIQEQVFKLLDSWRDYKHVEEQLAEQASSGSVAEASELLAQASSVASTANDQADQLGATKCVLPHLVAAAAVGLGVAGILGACSGDDSPSLDEYRERAGAICAAADEATATVTPDPADPAAAADAVDQIVARQQEALDELRALDVPSAEADNLDAWLGAVGATLEADAEVATRLREGADPNEAATRARAAEAEADRLAHDLGLDACAGT